MDDAVIHRRIIIVTQEHDVQQVGLVSTVELPEVLRFTGGHFDQCGICGHAPRLQTRSGSLCSGSKPRSKK